MKTKTYILTLSTRFPKGHPREGEDTDFADRARRGLHYAEHPGYDSPLPSKIHTIRADYGLWKQRIDEVNAGRAVLSVREWLGAPRRSKQRELFRFDKDSGIGVEKLQLVSNGELFAFRQRGQDSLNTPVKPDTLARNDGLSQIDWWAWSPTCRASQGRTSPLRCSTRGTVITDPITPSSRTCSGSTEEGGDHGED